MKLCPVIWQRLAKRDDLQIYPGAYIDRKNFRFLNKSYTSLLCCKTFSFGLDVGVGV